MAKPPGCDISGEELTDIAEAMGEMATKGESRISEVKQRFVREVDADGNFVKYLFVEIRDNSFPPEIQYYYSNCRVLFKKVSGRNYIRASEPITCDEAGQPLKQELPRVKTPGETTSK